MPTQIGALFLNRIRGGACFPCSARPATLPRETLPTIDGLHHVRYQERTAPKRLPSPSIQPTALQVRRPETSNLFGESSESGSIRKPDPEIRKTGIQTERLSFALSGVPRIAHGSPHGQTCPFAMEPLNTAIGVSRKTEDAVFMTMPRTEAHITRSFLVTGVDSDPRHGGVTTANAVS